MKDVVIVTSTLAGRIKEKWNRKGTGILVAGLVMVVAGTFFIIPGGIGMYTYRDAPHTDMCEGAGEAGSGIFYHCSIPEEGATVTFVFGVGLAFTGVAIVLIVVGLRLQTSFPLKTR